MIATGPDLENSHTSMRCGAYGRRLLVALLIAAYLAILIRNFAPGLESPDVNGYYAQGSLLATTGKTYFVVESPVQFVGRHWLVTGDGRFYSRYSPGFPVLIASVYRVLGANASLALNGFLALLGVFGIYLLVNIELGGYWGVAAAFILATNVTFNIHSMISASHMLALVLLLFGFLFFVIWTRSGRIASVFAAALCIGCLPAVRPPEALYGMGAAAFILAHSKGRPRVWLHWLAAAAGGLVPLVPFLLYNHYAFGAFWKTAYELTREQSGFSLRNILYHVPVYARTLFHGDGLGIFFPLGVAGVAVMCSLKGQRRTGWPLVLFFTPVTLLYMAYYWAPIEQVDYTARFLLPTFPLYIYAGLWAVRRLRGLGGWHRRLRVILSVLITLQAVWGGARSLIALGYIHRAKSVFAQVTRVLDANVPPRSVVIANSDIQQHLDFVRRWRLVDLTLAWEHPFEKAREDADAGGPQMIQTHKRLTRALKYVNLAPDAREEAFARDVLAWAGAGDVFYVGTEADMNGMHGKWFRSANFRIVARSALPKPSASRFGAAIEERWRLVLNPFRRADEFVVAKWTVERPPG